MKLKKIVSLALAGILAVSMLTACGEGASEPTTPPAEDPTPASVIADALNDELFAKQAALLSFESNSKLASLLERIAKDDEDFEIMNNGIRNAGYPTLLNPAAGAGTFGNLINGFVVAAYNGTNPAVTMTNADVAVWHDDNRAYLYVYTVDGSMQEASEIAAAVMNGVGGNGLQNHVYAKIGAVDHGNADEDIDFEYKGYAEMVKITNSNSSDTAWVVAVLVEQHAVSNT